MTTTTYRLGTVTLTLPALARTLAADSLLFADTTISVAAGDGATSISVPFSAGGFWRLNWYDAASAKIASASSQIFIEGIAPRTLEEIALLENALAENVEGVTQGELVDGRTFTRSTPEAVRRRLLRAQQEARVQQSEQNWIDTYSPMQSMIIRT